MKHCSSSLGQLWPLLLISTECCQTFYVFPTSCFSEVFSLNPCLFRAEMSGSCSDSFRRLARQHSNAISPWWSMCCGLWVVTPVLHSGYIARCGVGRNQECKESPAEVVPERRRAAERYVLLQLSFPCPCAAFIKFRPENLDSRSLLVYFLPHLEVVSVDPD